MSFSVPADFLSTVYTYHLKTDDDENDWNQMYQYYQIARTSHEQTRALMAISFTENTDRLNRYGNPRSHCVIFVYFVERLLSEGLTGGPYAIKRQDYFTMMGYMSRHVIGRNIAWNFYKNNYSNLVDTSVLIVSVHRMMLYAYVYLVLRYKTFDSVLPSFQLHVLLKKNPISTK